MAALLSLVVVETESGAEVRLRDADQGESYPDVYAALDSLLADEEYRAKAVSYTHLTLPTNREV